MQRKIDAMHARYGRCPGVCRDCNHLIHKLWDKAYYKCEMYGDSNSEATDWRMSWPACGMLNQPTPPGFTPVIEEIKHAARPRAPESEIPGQVSLFPDT